MLFCHSGCQGSYLRVVRFLFPHRGAPVWCMVCGKVWIGICNWYGDN